MTHVPFPYFGGKARTAPKIIELMGEVTSYCEPFCGSAAVLLTREPSQVETLNDLDGLLVNALRGIKHAPEQIADLCNYPITELDLHARQNVLVANRTRITEQLRSDPEWVDPKLAAWWIWGACSWLGSGWCRTDSNNTLPLLSNPGTGVHRRTLPAFLKRSKKRVYVDRDELLELWMPVLSKRLSRVRITCGDWKRVVTRSALCAKQSKDSVGLFLDPPYGSERAQRIYTHDDASIIESVSEWALRAAEEHPRWRIVLAAYDGDVVLPGWTCIDSQGRAVYAQTKRHQKERLWASPACLS